VSERVKRLLAEARAWCDEERGRQTKLAAYLGVSRHSLNAWFAEALRDRPRKQPTAEQALGIGEFLQAQRARGHSGEPK
jgi:DNA-binding XRE family transcriptional regulator